MTYRPLSRFLLRAPLLTVAEGARGAAALRKHPLGRTALALASPDLEAALRRNGGGKEAERALANYARRASFRPTPHGLLAGVTVGALADATQIATGAARAVLAPSWARLAAFGRALLDEADVRAAASLRVAPSLMLEPPEIVWLALGEQETEVRRAELDPLLEAAVGAAAAWTPWSAVRAAVLQAQTREGRADVEGADELLLTLLDEGLLHHDLMPPLVGPAPLVWMRARLEALALSAVTPLRAALGEVEEAAADGDLARLRSALRALPGELGAGVPEVHATLAHDGEAPRLARAAIERAAALAPLLFRLQEALAPPAAERALDGGLAEEVAGFTEIYGAGALEVAALATGEYGAELAALDDEGDRPPADPGVVTHLAAALVQAARDGDDELRLDPAALDDLLPPLAAPPTCELVLAPAPAPPRALPGAGWLLGLHAPASASLGRFAHALGDAGREALAELASAERSARPGEEPLDVAFAASAALADLSAHPAVRRRVLALSSWPDGDAVGAADLSLVADAAALDAVALRDGARTPVRPSPLHRVRSTVAAPGIYRLLAGWSFFRQHAPWALSWGPLLRLPRLPRVTLDGFVIAPASWHVPAADQLGAAADVARWRRREGVPRHVQVGEGDELLLVDLAEKDAARTLARHAGARAYEVWPPLDALVDAGGRRVEVIVSIVAAPDSDERAAHDAATAAVRDAGVVPPPRRQPPSDRWTTHLLFGADARQDHLLVSAVAPAIREALAAGEIDRWFFVRYRDGGRDHLRVRARTRGEPEEAAFAIRLRAVLAPLREAGDVVGAGTADYFPEVARYGGHDTLDDVEHLFELDSELAVRLIETAAEVGDDADADRIELTVRSLDALTRGLGLDLEGRLLLARRRRAAYERDVTRDERAARAAAFRERQRRLVGTLAGASADPFTAAFDGHTTRVRALVAERSAARVGAVVDVLAPVLHHAAVRLLGADHESETDAFVFWERALDALAARKRRSRS